MESSCHRVPMIHLVDISLDMTKRESSCPVRQVIVFPRSVPCGRSCVDVILPTCCCSILRTRLVVVIGVSHFASKHIMKHIQVLHRLALLPISTTTNDNQVTRFPPSRLCIGLAASIWTPGIRNVLSSRKRPHRTSRELHLCW